LDFAKRLIALRRDNPVLRQGQYLHGQVRQDGLPDVAWSSLNGGPLNWRDPSLDEFCLHIRGAANAPFSSPGTAFIVVNGGNRDRQVVLPAPGAGRCWARALDTAAPTAAAVPSFEGKRQPVSAHALVLFVDTQVTA
jgi:glycogen operon protein